MDTHLQKRIPDLSIAAAGTILFAVIVARASMISFTCDEATSFLDYSIRTWEKIFTTDNANNHVLNSALMRVVSDYLGDSVFLLRLPNVIAGGLFLLYSGLLVRRLNIAPWMRLALFLLINCNFMVLEFFSLARGYGLASGWMMASIYYIYRMFETRSVVRYAAVATAALMLATMSSFMVANFAVFALLMIPVAAALVCPWKEMRWWGIIARALCLLLLLKYSVNFLQQLVAMGETLKAANALYFGAETALDSLRSVAFGITCGIEIHLHGFSDPFAYCMAGLLVIALVCILLRLKNFFRSHETAFAVFMGAALCASLAAHYVQHHYMDVLYPILRTGIYLIVLWTIVFAMAVVTLPEKIRKAGWIVLTCVTLVPVLSLLLNMSFHSVPEWESAEGMDEGMSAVIRHAEAQPGDEKFMLSCAFELVPVANYYIYTSGTQRLNMIHFEEGGWQPGRDYYILSKAEDTTFTHGFTAVHSGKRLAFVTAPATTCTFVPEVHEDYETPGSLQAEGKTGQFSSSSSEQMPDTRLVRDTVRDTIPAGTRYRITAWIKTEHYRNINWMALSMQRAGTSLFWRAIDMRWTTRSAEWSRLDFVFITTVELLPGDELTFHVHSEMHPFLIDDFTLSRRNCP